MGSIAGRTVRYWAGREIKDQIYDAVRDGYLLVFDNKEVMFVDRGTLAYETGMSYGMVPYRPQPLVGPAPRPLQVGKLTPQVPSRTQVIRDMGWGGGGSRPRLRRYLRRLSSRLILRTQSAHTLKLEYRPIGYLSEPTI